MVAKAEGRIVNAETLLREAVALLDEQDPYRFMRWCLAELPALLPWPVTRRQRRAGWTGPTPAGARPIAFSTPGWSLTGPGWQPAPVS